MVENLLVAVIGKSNSGKSHTWNRLFGKTVKTGTKIRRLDLGGGRYVKVFLVSGSPEERKEYVGDIIDNKKPRIVLCSIQYGEEATDTIDWFVENGYFMFIHWLNPGFHDDMDEAYFDYLGLMNRILCKESVLGVRNGKLCASERVNEMRDFILGWAESRDLVKN